MSLLSDFDLHLFNEGRHARLYRHLGAHARPDDADGSRGADFAVWAPNAEAVSVIGAFNDWDKARHPLRPKGESGIWEGFVPGAAEGAAYKYFIRSRHGEYAVDKADPFAFRTGKPPDTVSVVCGLDYDWGDADWMASRAEKNSLSAPMSVYEVHLGSWRRVPEEGNRPLTYRETARQLVEYVKWMGFTHVEFLPLMEHPFYGSWGYQVSGFFAPTSRYGTPQDFMRLIDILHQNGIGVILDWVPSHFLTDEHGLGFFDGTHLYEHADPRQGFHPEWNSFIFNYGRHEVRSFLISNALFWLDKYHADGLRVDAVASMLYLDYARPGGKWIPNEFGGRENLEAVRFLRDLNSEIYAAYPDVQTIAEESSDWPMVSRPCWLGGLGFGMKWDMGWMHDTLRYMARDPVHRKHHHRDLTFRMLYSCNENFMLPLSHDEVVHGKGSLLRRMAGDVWRKFANLRLLFAYMHAQPGKKLLFMGGEFGQWDEWYHERSLDWHLADAGPHRGIQLWVRDLNRFHRDEPAMHELDCDPAGFEWVDCADTNNSVLTLLRTDGSGERIVLGAFNFTPVPRPGYRVGVPFGGRWAEVLNSDTGIYGGSGVGNLGGVEARPEPCHGRPFSLVVTLPPLAAVFFRHEKHA